MAGYYGFIGHPSVHPCVCISACLSIHISLFTVHDRVNSNFYINLDYHETWYMWYWLTVGQGLLSLQQIRVEGYFFCSFTFFYLPFLPYSSFISTISSVSFLSFSGRWHKMTHKGWHVKPHLNQKNLVYMRWYCGVLVWDRYYNGKFCQFLTELSARH